MKNLDNIFLIGPMGSGKSTVGKELAKKLNFNFYDSDSEIESKLGCKIRNLFLFKGEYFFRIQEEKIISKLTKRNNIVLSTGGGSILSKISREKMMQRGFIVYLSINLDVQIERIKNSDRPLIKNCKNIKYMLKKISLEREFLYKKICNFEINTSYYSVSYITNSILKILK